MMSNQGGGSTSDNTSKKRPTGANDTAKTTDDQGRRPRGLPGRVALVLVGVILVATVAGGNLAVAADRTVLDSDHVIQQMDEEGLFAEQGDEFRDTVADEIDSGIQGLSLPPGIGLGEFDSETTAEESVTTDYVREQTTNNIERLYAFLQGDRDEVSFVLDITTVKRSVAESVARDIVVDTPTLIGESTDRLDREQIAALESDEESFQEAQEDLSDREVQALKADVESTTEEGGYTTALTDALVSLQFTVVDGLAGELTYDEYTSQLTASEDDLKTALGDEAVADIDDTVTLDEEEESGEALSRAADAVQLIETLVVALPALALVLVGVIGALTRDIARTARTAGGALVGAGLLGAVAGFVAPGFVVPDTEDADPVADALVATVESFFETLGTQSILLVVGGAILVGVAVAQRRGYLDGIIDR